MLYNLDSTECALGHGSAGIDKRLTGVCAPVLGYLVFNYDGLLDIDPDSVIMDDYRFYYGWWAVKRLILHVDRME